MVYLCGNLRIMNPQEKELDFIDYTNINNSWLLRFNEKLTLILLKLRDKTDLIEDDYECIEVLYRIHRDQEYPLYRPVGDLHDDVAVQVGLFAENLSGNDAKPAVINPNDDLAL
jgi:hypothetical protein